MKPKATSVSRRGELLQRGQSLTETSREKTYGNMKHSMQVQQEIMSIIDKNLVHADKGYKAALNNVAIKLARAIVGPQPGEDTFVDGAVYFSMAGEILYPGEK